jgi:hypothetical protein
MKLSRHSYPIPTALKTGAEDIMLRCNKERQKCPFSPRQGSVSEKFHDDCRILVRAIVLGVKAGHHRGAAGRMTSKRKKGKSDGNSQEHDLHMV